MILIKAIQKHRPNCQFNVAGKYPEYGLEWNESNPLPKPTSQEVDAWVANYVDVPQAITPRQARLILNQYNLRQAVEDAIASSGQDVKDEWDYATAVQRAWPMLVSLASNIGITDEQLDQMFIEASQL